MIQFIKYETMLMYDLKKTNVYVELGKLFDWKRVCRNMCDSEYVSYIVCETHSG